MNLTIAVHFLNSNEEDSEEVQLDRRQLRDTCNVLEMPTNLFVANFRVTKEIFSLLLQKLQSTAAPNYGSHYILPQVKLATFLRFLATGSYQQTIGNEMVSSCSKTTVCRIVTDMLDFFENHICADWIKMITAEEENATKEAFFEKTGFPGIIGCVDGTHVRIKSPGDHLKHLYYNRKGFYSLNVMVICNDKTYIMYVDARHPGANHDAFVWEQSSINQQLQSNFESGQKNTWILGDAGYKLKPFLMTPFRTPSNTIETRYNKKHSSARNVIERCFGVLKNRFRSIIGSRGLHYSPAKATKIVNACCALHNMCIYYKCLDSEIREEIEANDEIVDVEEMEDTAMRIRRNIAMNL